MTDPKSELVRKWLDKAQEDLRVAQILARHDDPPAATAIYHCQQAGEKAVKGFLVWKDHPLEKTHDIGRLARLALALEPGFGAWIETARKLTQYAIAYRYPRDSGPEEPDAAELNTALDYAERLCKYVLRLLPAGIHPDSIAPNSPPP